MLTKTKIALAAVVVLGFAGGSAASDNNSGDYYGGFVIPGSTDGVNPVDHPGWFGKAWNSGRANNAFAYAPEVYATPRGTFCPTLEGYPDCR
jgi:hypothetical protein